MEKRGTKNLRISLNEERFRILAEASSSGLVIHQKGVIQLSNNALAALTGYDQSELIGMNSSELIAPAWRHLLKDYMLNHDETPCELMGIRKDGVLYPLEIQTKVILSRGHKISVAEFRDAARHRKTKDALMLAKEVAESASRSKSEFLVHMSHEVRTQLNAIIGLADLALRSRDGAEHGEYLDMIKSAGNTVLALVNDLLDFGKIESGKIELERIHFDLKEVIQRSIEAHSAVALKSGLKFSVSMSPEKYPLLIGDPERLRQILSNLVSNAVKFTHVGEISVAVSMSKSTARIDGRKGAVFPEESAFVTLHFTVKDTGIGIPEERKEHIFERFVQGDGSMQRIYGGSGLGTAIAKSLVEMMGGTIWFESEYGVGTTFHFTAEFGLRKKYGRRRKPRKYTFPPSLVEVLRRKKTLNILVAEDNLFNRRLIVDSLRLSGHKADVAENGREALELWKKRTYDFILMDVQMPDMNGLAATDAIRRIEKTKGGHIPVIACSANVSKEDRKKFLDAGMDGYIPKPVDMDALNSTFIEISGRVMSDRIGNVCSKGYFSPKDRLQDLFDFASIPNMKSSRKVREQYARLFLNDLRFEIERMTEAVGKGEARTLRDSAHAVKGMTGHLKSPVLARMASELERLGAENRLDKTSEKIVQLREQALRLFEVLEKDQGQRDHEQ